MTARSAGGDGAVDLPQMLEREDIEPELAEAGIPEASIPDPGLIRGEDRFRTPHDQVENYAIVLLDTKGKPTSWNAGIRRVLGYEKAEFLRTAAADLYPLEDRERGIPATDLAEAARRGQYLHRALAGPEGRQPLLGIGLHHRRARWQGPPARVRPAAARPVEGPGSRRSSFAASRMPSSWPWRRPGSAPGSTISRPAPRFLDARARALFGIPADEPLTAARCWTRSTRTTASTPGSAGERAVRERAPYSAEYRVVWPDGSVHWIMAMGRCVDRPGERARRSSSRASSST